jgi:hypothetical protein
MKTESSILGEIRDKKELSDELTEKLHAEIKKFAGMFNVQD